jgi:tyrosyl-tRNA synthetase
LKKALARRITQDFHGEEAAKAADEGWAKQFQRDEVPENVETVEILRADVEQKIDPPDAVHSLLTVRIERLIHKAGLADSLSDARRKIEQGAVRIDGEVTTKMAEYLTPDVPHMVRVGKKLKRISIK